MRLITGYKGTADIRVAVESGEVDGICGFSWASIRATWRKAIESGLVIVMLQNAPKSSPDLQKVPLAISFAKTDEARQLDRRGHSPAQRSHLRLLATAGDA